VVRSITEIRREEITEAVLVLLAEQGPRALSVQAIASQVGMAKASLYQHFNSVDEMMEAAITSIKTKFLDLIVQARQTVDDPKERLWVIFRNVSRLPTVPEAMFSLMRMESKSAERWRANMLEIRDSMEAELYHDFKAAQDAGHFRADLPPAHLQEAAFALYHFLKTEVMQGCITGEFDEQLQHTWELFCRLADKRSEF
jgi:TetR/AcrR family transcriptional regulator, regulator of autoinduction and epiphytic fitness